MGHYVTINNQEGESMEKVIIRISTREKKPGHLLDPNDVPFWRKWIHLKGQWQSVSFPLTLDLIIKLSSHTHWALIQYLPFACFIQKSDYPSASHFQNQKPDFNILSVFFCSPSGFSFGGLIVLSSQS